MVDLANSSLQHVSSQLTEFNSQLLNDVLDGLSQPVKKLNPKYFYDEKGSAYFDEICSLDEYYPYQTELTLLPRIAQDTAELLSGDYSIVEFGAGSLKKIKPLFEAMRGIKRFVPIDISGAHLRSACQSLQEDYPDIIMHPIEADFSLPVILGERGNEKNLGFFPGSTIGNFTPEDARNFLYSAKMTLGKDGYLLIGVDTKKSPNILHKAYNDQKGVTAKFNLNILDRINRDLDTDFQVDKFEHYAFYNAGKGCVEMYLMSSEDQVVDVDGAAFQIKEGESIHTESSYKYTPEEFTSLAMSAGWSVKKQWLAEDNMFSTFLLSNR